MLSVVFLLYNEEIMAQINLAPGSQYLSVVRRRRRILYILAALIAVVTVSAGLLLKILVSQAEHEKQAVRQELYSVETRIAQASAEVKRVQLFERRLETLDELLNNHQTWTLYLQELERLLPPGTVLTYIQGSHAMGAVEFSGSAPSLDGIAQALASLQDQSESHPTLFSSGTVSAISHVAETGAAGGVLGQRYTFKMTLTLHTPPAP